MQKELTIEGVRPPPTGAVSLPPQSQNIPQIQVMIVFIIEVNLI